MSDNTPDARTVSEARLAECLQTMGRRYVLEPDDRDYRDIRAFLRELQSLRAEVGAASARIASSIPAETTLGPDGSYQPFTRKARARDSSPAEEGAVKRYDIYMHSDDVQFLRECPDGDYVRFAAYDAKCAEVERLKREFNDYLDWASNHIADLESRRR